MFERKDWEQLLGRSIVPKLAFALQQELAINPLHQELEPFNWVLTWQDVMPLNQARPAGCESGWLAGWAWGRTVCSAQYERHCASMRAGLRHGGCGASCWVSLFRNACPTPVSLLTPWALLGSCISPPPPCCPAAGLPVRAVLLSQVARCAAALAVQQPQLRRGYAMVSE